MHRCCRTSLKWCECKRVLGFSMLLSTFYHEVERCSLSLFSIQNCPSLQKEFMSAIERLGNMFCCLCDANVIILFGWVVDGKRWCHIYEIIEEVSQERYY
jgi:hypothetical protein